ncbi:MAG: PD-(D/E)XK nuclease family protein, partial [Anaerolineae bacterium]
RLEAYRTCPFYFFTSKVLALEPREEPREGLDWLQRGNLYHKILERVYRAVGDPTDLDQLLAALPKVARPVLDEAPARQGFRETAWWAQTREEILEDVRGTLEALSEEEQLGDFVPLCYEAAFGLWGEPPLVVPDPGRDDAFELHGLIDRVDRDVYGRVRIIDYKTAGPSDYSNAALREGERIQLPLYALAARDALGLGQPVSGFYWHVRHAEPSPLKLEDFGIDEAIRTAVAHAWDVIRSAREGQFVPQTPGGGCPSYCSAAGFCWHYERRWFDTAT